MTDQLSAAQARRIALAAQGFGRARPAKVTRRHLHTVMDTLGVLQIDSVNTFSRSHYMPAFSRLGTYDTALLDDLVFASGSPYTEYWAHEATFIPREDWRLWQFRMDSMRAAYLDPWLEAHPETVDYVVRELAGRGPLRPADIEHESNTTKRGPWWDWSVVKRTLEHLFLAGVVAIDSRQSFQRTYALAEHVIAPEVLATSMPKADAVRELVRRAMTAYGVATAKDVADYYRIRDRAAVATALAELTDEGHISPVTVNGWEHRGKPLDAWRAVDARTPRKIEATALLTPFDPVVWFRDRASRMFGFDYRIEIYTPADKRVFGYYSLPVLVDDNLVGRIDLKADRGSGTLLVQSAWWEDANSQQQHAERVAGELRAAATWQGLERVSVGTWGNASDDIAAALGPRESVPRHTRKAE